MPWPQTGTTHYHAHPDKGGAIKGLVVCYVLWLGSMKGIGLRTSAEYGPSLLLWSGWLPSSSTASTYHL